MAVGQAVLPSVTLDVAEVRRLSDELEVGERDRSVQHAEQLRRVLDLDRVYRRAGMELGTAAQVALLLNCSEHRANLLLTDARVLDRLGALAVMRDGLLTVEQARVVVDVLGVVDDAVAAAAWNRLEARLLLDTDAVLPPARLRELLQRWLLTEDPGDAVARRKRAQQDSTDVEVWRRDDGLTDLALRGITGPNAQAILARVSDHSDPIGPYDERTPGQRRLAAAVDLMLGRTALPFQSCQPGCACGLGAEVPCGAQVFVHVPLPTALGASDEPADAVGHGPIDRDLLDQLLQAAPVLHRVWVDPQTGVPVAVDDRTWHPARRDPDAVRTALLEMSSGPPPPAEQRHPVHRDDHDTVTPHVADPGGYVPPRRLKRLLRARAPRCEWPGCGRRSTAPTPCDLDHDLAWPYGPTCACNLGPLCRRHHRIKQLGWIKHRQGDGSVRWTSPTGRTCTSPAQHPIPRATRPIPPLPDPDPLGALTQYELDLLMQARGPEPQERLDLEASTPEDLEPLDDGPLLRTTSDLWTLLHDDSAWHDWPEPQDRS